MHGVISSDEPINGISPNLGTETCDVSDMTYSAQHMLRVTGRGVYADRIERAALNAGPGAVRGEESVLPTVYCTVHVEDCTNLYMNATMARSLVPE